MELKWELTAEKFIISNLKAEAFGGTVTGVANLPLAHANRGGFEFKFKDVDAAAASELVPDFPVKVAGKVSGSVAGAIPPAKAGESRVGNLAVDITAPQLTVQGIPAERLTGKAAIQGSALQYELEGRTLGGSFEIKGRYPGQKKDALPKEEGKRERGSFRLTGVDLSRLAGGMGFTVLEPLRGRLDANFDFDNDLSSGSGRVTITRLQWGGNVVAQELTGLLLLREGLLQLSEVNGRLAGGALRARGQMRFDNTKRNFFTISVIRADAKRLLTPFGGNANDLLEGSVSVVVHAQLGSETRGSGTITLPRGSVSGVQVTDLRVPFTFASAPGGYGRFVVQEASVLAGSGRARAELTLDWGREARVKGQITFTNVPLRTIVPELGENARPRQWPDHRAVRHQWFPRAVVRRRNRNPGATLNNTSVKEIPILRQVTPFLNTTGLVKPFQSGDVPPRLANGVFRVERLALANPAAQLFAEGTIATNGRVDLNVVAHTGTIGPEIRALRVLGLRIPALGPLPLATHPRREQLPLEPHGATHDYWNDE